MVEKFVVDPKKADQETMAGLAQKLNEVIDVVNQPMRRPAPPVPTNLQHAEMMEAMARRLQSGPLQFISKPEPNDLTKAVGEALDKFQAAVTAYKESLDAAEPKAAGTVELST